MKRVILDLVSGYEVGWGQSDGLSPTDSPVKMRLACLWVISREGIFRDTLEDMYESKTRLRVN